MILLQIKTIKIHYFIPCCNKIFYEFFFCIILCINFSKCTKL